MQDGVARVAVIVQIDRSLLAFENGHAQSITHDPEIRHGETEVNPNRK